MPRPLLDRLFDIEHSLKLDNQPLHAKTIREAIEELMRLRPSAQIIPLHPPPR